jgi:hypothetical protein
MLKVTPMAATSVCFHLASNSDFDISMISLLFIPLVL